VRGYRAVLVPSLDEQRAIGLGHLIDPEDAARFVRSLIGVPSSDAGPLRVLERVWVEDGRLLGEWRLLHDAPSVVLA